MTPNDVIKIATMADFYKLRDKLSLTNRQKSVFYMKYSLGMKNIDIAEALEPPVCQDTVSSDLKVIREKLAQICIDND